MQQEVHDHREHEQHQGHDTGVKPDQKAKAGADFNSNRSRKQRTNQGDPMVGHVDRRLVPVLQLVDAGQQEQRRNEHPPHQGRDLLAK